MGDRAARILGWTIVGAILAATAALIAGIGVIARQNRPMPPREAEASGSSPEGDAPYRAQITNV
jgi:hypothetical protein